MMENKRHAGVLRYDSGGFMIRGAAHYQVGGPVTGELASVWNGWNLLVLTGGLEARCNLTVIEHSEEPHIDQDPAWAEIVEVSVASEDEGLWLDMAGNPTPGFEGSLTAGGSGSYRVRIYAAGRGRAYELIDKFSDELPESFKLDLWSAPPREGTVIKSSDWDGKGWQQGN